MFCDVYTLCYREVQSHQSSPFGILMSMINYDLKLQIRDQSRIIISISMQNNYLSHHGNPTALALSYRAPTLPHYYSVIINTRTENTFLFEKKKSISIQCVLGGLLPGGKLPAGSRASHIEPFNLCLVLLEGQAPVRKSISKSSFHCFFESFTAVRTSLSRSPGVTAFVAQAFKADVSLLSSFFPHSCVYSSFLFARFWGSFFGCHSAYRRREFLVSIGGSKGTLAFSAWQSTECNMRCSHTVISC